MLLKGFQKQYLRGLAHASRPVVMIGQKGINENLLQAFTEALESHELIKVKFIDFKEKEQKKTLIAELEEKTYAQLVGLTGHTAIFFRQNRDPEKRIISVPKEKK
ncbi:MAG TPA: YhbY family RNA-binding protein [Proteobacteria bacterium]|nr:YhbY family RNA-binding protein [Pseudomonadota bacterium]